MSIKPVSVEERSALLSAMGARIDWDSLTSEQVQAAIKDPGLGIRVTSLIQSGHPAHVPERFRKTGELSIRLPALKRPAPKKLQAEHAWIKSLRDASTEAPVTMTFATVLVIGEGKSINGTEYEKRITTERNRLLGFQHREWILEHQDEFPSFKNLLGKIYVDFPGIVLVDRNGDRRIPSCHEQDSRWGGRWAWLDSGFNSMGRIAIGE